METAIGYAALVALGGALGGVARHAVTGAVAARFGEAFPWGTLAVNASGAALIGLLTGIAPPGGMWLFLGIGVLGAYTTVSSFALQTLSLWRNGRWLRAAANMGVSLALCLMLAAAGWGLGAAIGGSGGG